MASTTPPRFVPTLTEVVSVPDAAPAAAPPPPAAAAPADLAEQLLQHLMPHVEQLLDQRLRAVIASVAQQQTQSMLPRLREELQALVREALADGRVHGPNTPPTDDRN